VSAGNQVPVRGESVWLAEFDRVHRPGHQILLYGNISDMFKYEEEARFLSLPLVLDRYFADQDYQVVVH
jgi:hypothetical protein